MNKKTTLQLLLSSMVVAIFLTIFLKYFNEELEFKKEKNSEEKISKVLKEKSNIIEDIRYLSKDNTGNIYVINAEYGEINEDNPDIIFLKNVKAKISIFNSEDFFIESDCNFPFSFKPALVKYSSIFFTCKVKF